MVLKADLGDTSMGSMGMGIGRMGLGMGRMEEGDGNRKEFVMLKKLI